MEPETEQAGEEEAASSEETAKEQKAFRAATEIMTSEKTYVNDLKLLDEFMKLVKVGNILSEENLDGIFSNLQHILILNTLLLKEFEIRIENWDTNPKISDVLVKQGPFLKVYAEYSRDNEAAQQLFFDCRTNSPVFEEIVENFEENPRSRGVKLQAHLVSPVQRLMRYKMLLEAYLKHQHGETLDFEDTKEALKIVSDVASAVNWSFSVDDEQRRMHELQERVGDYGLVQSARRLLKDGSVVNSLRNKVSIPAYLILVTDSLIWAHHKVV